MPTLAGHPLPYSRATVNSFRRSRSSLSDTEHDLDINSTPGRPLGTGPGYQLRKTSALSYQNSGPRDLQDRSYSRSSRNLVVVIPPSDLPLDHGQLGNVLSMGPRHRLAQGILMPLFPSMFGQLNAIAREYNFPSTVGLCLFLHINENGETMTPRISDDSWQYLFGHLFDSRASSDARSLPIGGSIEFDIDLNKARWFDSWVSGNLRDSGPIHSPVGNSSEAYWRREIQTLKLEEQPAEDQSHTLVANSRSETFRHLPKKLSLVDRHSVQVPPKSQDPDFSESSPTHGTYASSPILQSAIPQAAENDLEHRINSWRTSTELYPLSMAETYQPVPDVGVSASATIMDEYALVRNFGQAIDEYLWPATSEGPRTPAAKSPISSYHGSSVHLDRRANGTAPLTQIVMTSWGPNNEQHSVVSSATRLPSPDVGERVVEDIMGPRPRAVWGNSFGWRSAMTWKDVYPYSFIETKPVVRVQLQNSSISQYPNLEIYPSMSLQFPLNTPEGPNFSSRPVWGRAFGWERAVTWRNTYPYSTVQSLAVGPIQLCGAGRLGSEYPNLCIYPVVYPYFVIYPACSVKEDITLPVSVTLSGSNGLSAYYPSLVIYPAMYPNLDIYPPAVEGMQINRPSQVDANIYTLGSVSIVYPNLIIYPAVYPHFDLYSKILQISETVKQKEVDVRLVTADWLTAGYPNMTIYPGAYPHLEIYPVQHVRQSSAVVWGLSFGWPTARTWVQVYPFQTAAALTTKGHVYDQSKFISNSGTASTGTADGSVGNQAVWGNSFGWKSATTWRTVWPTPYARIYGNVSPIPSDSSNYPHLVIYPSTYPHFNIYPHLAARPTEEIQLTVDLITYYPNLIIYPPAYPHFDLYPTLARSFVAVEHGKGESDLRRRRIETWRARTAAQVRLSELLLNNHIWEVDEPLQLDLADYAWSRTSAGPGMSPLELLDTPSISGSVHIDRRIQGSVLCTPLTATTWGPQDVDWYSEIDSIERLPSPDLGQRVLDDVEFPCRPWHMVPSALEQFLSVSEYPHLVIYPPAYPHFELYPASTNAPISRNEAAETLTNSDVYHTFRDDPVVYPYFNIYPASDSQIQIPSNIVPNVQHESMDVRLTSLYPNFDIYPLAYPFIIPYPSLSAEPSESEKSTVSSSIGLSVRLPIWYPVLELYPAGYPWSLDSIYPAVSIDNVDDRSVLLKSQYPCIRIYTPVYPFVEPFPGASDPVRVPGTLDEGELESVRTCLASSEIKPIDPEPAIDAYPYSDLYSTALMPVAQQGRVEQDAYVEDLTTPPLWAHIPTRRQRKTHQGLHDLVFRSLGKQPARISRTHLQLHTEVFQDGVVWTPSGYMQDLSSLITKKREDDPVPETQPHRPPNCNFRPTHPRSGITSAPASDKFVFPPGQLPALPTLSPLRVRTPLQPSPAVSESPTPRGSPTSAHMRTRSARLSQAVKAIIPGHRRHVSAAPASLPDDRKERVKSPTRFLSLVDRRQAAVPLNTPEFLTRPLRNTAARESFVVQRAKAHDQANAGNSPSVTVGTKGTRIPFVLPPSPSVADVIEQSKTTVS